MTISNQIVPMKLITPGNVDYDAVVLADRPQVYCPLNDTSGTVARDWSGHRSHGTIQGGSGVTLNQQGPWSGSTAMAFNGSNGSVVIPTYPNVSTLTVELWAKQTASTGDNPRFIANGHPDNSNNGFELMVGLVGTTPGTGFAVGNGTTYEAAIDTSLADLTLGEWYYLVGTYDGAAVRLFINGQLKATTSAALGNLTANHEVGIAYNPSYSGDYLTGSVAKVAVYERVLTPSRILAHYNAGRTARKFVGGR